MSKIIEIKDKDANGILNLDLKDILVLIPEHYQQLIWIIYEIEASLLQESEINILELEKKVNESKNGLIVTFDELLTLSNNIFQTFNITVLVTENKMIIDRNNMFQNVELVIEIIDSSICSIYCNDESIISTLIKKYKDYRLIDEK